MKVLLCGGAGFIGSHLLPRLSKNKKNQLIVLDNFRTGKKEFLENKMKKKNVKLVKADLEKTKQLNKYMKGIDLVYHLVANADVRGGTKKTDTDIKLNTLTTFNVLEAMRKNKVKKLVFFSSTQVYGEATQIPTPEEYGPMIPTNLYGASKLAAEAFISAYCNCFNIQAYIFRLVNVVGIRGTHGVLGDFFEKLDRNSKEMEILGDGTQLKSFMYIDDCLNAIDIALKKAKEKVNIFNLGSRDWIDVTSIAKIVVRERKLGKVKFRYTGGERGWLGDVPKVKLSIKKLMKLGWKPKYNSRQAITKTVKEMIACRQ